MRIVTLLMVKWRVGYHNIKVSAKPILEIKTGVDQYQDVLVGGLLVCALHDKLTLIHKAGIIVALLRITRISPNQFLPIGTNQDTVPWKWFIGLRIITVVVRSIITP